MLPLGGGDRDYINWSSACRSMPLATLGRSSRLPRSRLARAARSRLPRREPGCGSQVRPEAGARSAAPSRTRCHCRELPSRRRKHLLPRRAVRAVEHARPVACRALPVEELAHLRIPPGVERERQAGRGTQLQRTRPAEQIVVGAAQAAEAEGIGPIDAARRPLGWLLLGRQPPRRRKRRRIPRDCRAALKAVAMRSA